MVSGFVLPRSRIAKGDCGQLAARVWLRCSWVTAALPCVTLRRMQRGLPAGQVEPNQLRFEAMRDGLELLRDWLWREVASADRLPRYLAERPGEALPAHYAFALGQVDRKVAGVLAAAAQPGDAPEQVAIMWGRLEALLYECRRGGEVRAVPCDRREVVRALAFRRAHRRLRSFMRAAWPARGPRASTGTFIRRSVLRQISREGEGRGEPS